MWFRSGDDYETQRKKRAVVCPQCGSAKISKAPMAPNVATGGAIRPSGSSGGAKKETVANWTALAQKVREHVEENFEYVGDQFPEKVREMDAGTEKTRDVYGEASPDEVKELLDEGHMIAPIPDVATKKSRKKMN